MTTATTQEVQPEMETQAAQPDVAKRSRRMVLAGILALVVVVSVSATGAVIFGGRSDDSSAGSSAKSSQPVGQAAPVAVPLPRLVR